MMRPALILVVLCLTSCGFEPVYRENASRLDTPDLLARIQFQTPFGRDGDQLKAKLEDGFYQSLQSEVPRYNLETSLGIGAQPFIIDSDGISSRYEITVNSNYRLTRLSDGQLLKSGRLQRKVSYNVSDQDDYSTYIARRDAIERGINEIAEEYRLRIAAILAQSLSKL